MTLNNYNEKVLQYIELVVFTANISNIHDVKLNDGKYVNISAIKRIISSIIDSSFIESRLKFPFISNKKHRYNNLKQDYEKIMFQELADAKVIVHKDGDFAGTYYQFFSNNYIKHSKDKLSSNPIHKLFLDLNDPHFLAKSFTKMEATDFDNLSSLNSEQSLSYEVKKPASDRIVTINHNQQIEFEKATNEIIEIVEDENSIDGDNDLRSQILGQLKAGLEFIKAGVFKSQLLFLSLIDALQVLVLRYEKEAVGALASALITELMKVL